MIDSIAALSIVPLHLTDVCHAAGPVRSPRDLDDRIDRGGDLQAKNVQRHANVAHEGHGLQSTQRVDGQRGMDSGKAPTVARCHCLNEVEGFTTAYLTDDDSIWPHSQRCFEKFSNGNPAAAPSVGRLCLEMNDVRQPEPKLPRIFDDDDALINGG